MDTPEQSSGSRLEPFDTHLQTQKPELLVWFQYSSPKTRDPPASAPGRTKSRRGPAVIRNVELLEAEFRKHRRFSPLPREQATTHDLQDVSWDLALLGLESLPPRARKSITSCPSLTYGRTNWTKRSPERQTSSPLGPGADSVPCLGHPSSRQRLLNTTLNLPCGECSSFSSHSWSSEAHTQDRP